jgi:membrane-bound metal-dependent hydrolase YbcI (DUF457 family)
MGHAFVGVATALGVPPNGKVPPADSKAGWWLSALVGLAYLPDIVGHGTGLLGLRGSRVISHSFPFALVASGLLAVGLALAFGTSYWRAAAISLGSVLGHDVLDLLQASDRVTGWPFFRGRIRLPFSLIPEGAVHEALVFAVAFLIFLVLWTRRGDGSSLKWWRQPAWRGGAVAGLILTTAVLTHAGEVFREREVDAVQDCLKHHEYTEALRHLKHLGLWPSMAQSAEVPRLTARALVGLGDQAGAEQQLLGAASADPNDYRTIVDLALFYASSDEAMPERRQRVAPYRARLERDFTRRWDLSRVLERIEERLVTPTPADQGAGASVARP